MNTELSREEKRTLRDRGHLNPNGRPNRSRIAEAILDLLERDHVADTHEEIAERAITHDEIALELWGLTGEALRQLVAEEMPLSARGAVQRLIDQDGRNKVLCAAPVPRQITAGEKTYTRNFKGKFLSSNPELIDAYNQVPMTDRVEALAKGFRASLNMNTARVPALAPYAARRTAELIERVQKALEPGRTP
jgi:hypothetical protein